MRLLAVGAVVIAIWTAVVFAAFGIHPWSGGAYQARTADAMAQRMLPWVEIARTIRFSAR